VGIGGSDDSNTKADDFTKQLKEYTAENIDPNDVQAGW
jgi:hypothetical protein